MCQATRSIWRMAQESGLNPRSSFLVRFTIKSIIEAPDKSTVQPELLNERVSLIIHNTSFAILADQRTVYTFEESDASDAKLLIRQNLDAKTVSTLASLDDDWYPETLLPDEERNTLLITGMLHMQNKSRMELRELSSGSLLKVFAFPDVFIVVEALRVHDLVFLGCSDNIVKVLDVVRNEVVYGSVKNAIQVDVTMDLCEVADPESGGRKFVLALGGSMPDYSQDKTDLLDVTQLVATWREPRRACEQASLLRQKDFEIARLKRELSSKQKEHRQKIEAMESELQELSRLQVRVSSG